jgi:transposase-like protein
MKNQFAATLAAITAHTSLSEIEILSSLSVEAVNARHILCQLLYEQGYTPRTIAQHLGNNTRTVSYAVTRFKSRCKQFRHLAKDYETIKKQIGNE